MKFRFSGPDLAKLLRSRQSTFLLTNGLGGYCSVSAAFSVPRCDQGILIAAVKAPNERINLVHRLSDSLQVGDDTFFLSAQEFHDGSAPEDGWKHLTEFSYEHVPCWTYRLPGVTAKRSCCMPYGENTSALTYTVENTSAKDCTLAVTPFFRHNPKEQALTEKKVFRCSSGEVTSGPYKVFIRTNGTLAEAAPRWEVLSYPEDAKDGRAEKGLTGSCCTVSLSIPPESSQTLELVFSTERVCAPVPDLFAACKQHLAKAAACGGFKDPIARQLAMGADAYIAHRASTGGKTILAGYPLFSDWGRDTMIALPGCTLCTDRFEDAKSILRTFLAYERNGLVPNLFPEGTQAPMYNTVDAALLLIDAVWQYVQRSGDRDFVREAFPVLERIVAAYRQGTDHAISMDNDGLIRAGSGSDQVTWMDVCINGILPTPRHGKPVEINAYWYNALRIMAEFSEMLQLDSTAYSTLSELVKRSFTEKFYLADRGYLRDVISGTKADDQLRCNQIWAVSMPFTMLSPEQERSVVDTVGKHLYTPRGLRTLSPEDPEYQPFYGGDQLKRDMAYHQGTAWVFPLGAYYRAYLKVNGNSPAAVQEVRARLDELIPMLCEGCMGQLPEIYDGAAPKEGKGCFAQAWSVGEMLRVFDALRDVDP